MSLLKSHMGLGSEAPAEETNSAALPASWYTSPEMYELERRAIFSKKWLLTTHKLRLVESGDWLRYEVAGFEFVITKDRTGAINAFHNVCRHRAFPIVTEEKGHNSVLSCKYHGWSYGLNGKLAKAPGYQDLAGFDKAANSLLPLHVHVDKNGFIWVNLDAGAKPEVAWSDAFDGAEQQKRLAAYDFENYQFDHTWELEGEHNWKVLADNYNECYHCKTAGPDVPGVADLSSSDVDTTGGHIQHLGNPTPEQIERGFSVTSTSYFPNASMNISPHFFVLQKSVPSGPGKSSMKYEVYRNKNSSDEDFQVINDIYKKVASELGLGLYLCTNEQKKPNAGVFINGKTQPAFQNSVRDLIQAHYKREVDADREIWPARQVLPESATATEKDIGFCSNVDCCRIKKETAAF
ncbi:Choline monooxygenase, chloroplastic [Ilyonectria robusta]